MRILLLSENFPPLKGGSAIWLHNLYARVRGHEVVYLAGPCDGDREFDATFPARIERVGMSMPDRDPTLPGSWPTYWRVARRVIAACRRSHVDQIHCGKVLPEGFVALLVRMILGIPYVVFCHGEEITTTSRSRRYRILVPAIYRRAAAVIANAANTARLLEDIGVRRERIRLLHPSVDTEPFENAASVAAAVREKHALGAGPILVTVGRLQIRKGHDTVIRAFPSVLARFPEARYVIAGDGEERARLEELARTTGVGDRVVFAGIVPDEELPGYYGAADVFVMPNRDVEGDFEGFGIVFLEAAACGAPVVGGDSGGAREAVLHGETGLLVDGEDPGAVGAAILELLEQPERARRLAAAGAERARGEFGYPKAARDLERWIGGSGTRAKVRP